MKLPLFAPLLAYPGPDYHARVRECAAVAPSPQLEVFERRIREMPFEALQELYTQTFDWNPDTTLEIGWHLYGENYDRGDFLVKLRGALREHGVPESHELPDHLAHVLPLLDRLPAGEQAEFAARYVLPAVEKLCGGLARSESPFLELLSCVRDCVGALVPETVHSGAEHE